MVRLHEILRVLCDSIYDQNFVERIPKTLENNDGF